LKNRQVINEYPSAFVVRRDKISGSGLKVRGSKLKGKDRHGARAGVARRKKELKAQGSKLKAQRGALVRSIEASTRSAETFGVRRQDAFRSEGEKGKRREAREEISSFIFPRGTISARGVNI
jgi:hypothetical protein